MEKIVLVEPEKPENTGFIARLAANFNADIRLVNPGFNLSEARKTANNAQEKLREAKIYGELEEAVEDLKHVIGTKPGRGTPLKEFKPRKDSSIVIGRESSGLSNRELELCDSVVHIETGEYPSINQSHAAGILMHSMFSRQKEKSGVKKLDAVSEETGQTTLKLLKRASPSSREAKAVIADFKKRN
ncbi:MAG: RNA methyltransferase [Candidatus Nanohalobium sp.]